MECDRDCIISNCSASTDFYLSQWLLVNVVLLHVFDFYKDRKKASDIKKESSSAVNTTSESSQISYDSNQAPSANGTSSEKLDPGEVPLKEQQNESVSLEEEKGRLFPRPSRSSENMMLLGGKSTPVSKKSNDSESKVEKETVVSTEPQAAAIARDGSSLRNVNKAISAGLTGLENYANNCYMNVVIQVLANLPEIRDYFIGKKLES